MLAKTPRAPAPLAPMIVHETDAVRVNRVMNDPDVLRYLLRPGDTHIDFSAVAEDPCNVLLTNEPGTIAIVFHRLEDGVYESHSAALPEARGPTMLATAKAMAGYMFTSTDAMELLTKVPKHNRRADALARAVGGVFDFETPAAWPTDHGLVGVRHYRLDFTQWVRTADLPAQFGAWLRGHLTDEFARLGIEDEPHDACHDRHIGSTVGMMVAGQPVKGTILHRRWAAFAGVEGAFIANLDPLVIGLGPYFLRVYPGNPNFEVLKCLPQQ